MDKTVEQLRKETNEIINSCDFHSPISRGRIREEILSIFLDQTKDDCPECGGFGVYPVYDKDTQLTYDYSCSNCNGTGKVGDWHPERLVVLKKGQGIVDLDSFKEEKDE